MQCPSDSELQQLVEGGVPPEALRELRAHLDGCDACRLTVAQAARDQTPGGLSLSATLLSPRAPPAAQEVTLSGRFGRYVLGERLGAGGMGVVYRAEDTVLGRPVALKILARGLSSVAAEERLVREAQAMARLSHPNVVAIYDVGHAEGRVFLSMELVVGATLAEWLAERERGWRDVLAVMIDAGKGLSAAHRVGLIHRDFKPANVLVDLEGRAHVADFGLAYAMTSDAAQPLPSEAPRAALATSLSGTPAYMAPEQLGGKVATERSDQFAYCVSLYEALYGQRPFEGRDLSEVWGAIRAGRVRPPPRRAGQGWLRRAIFRGLSVAPAERFESMDALLEVLGHGGRKGTRRWVAAGVAGALCVGALAGVAWVRWTASPPPVVTAAAPALPPAPAPVPVPALAAGPPAPEPARPAHVEKRHVAAHPHPAGKIVPAAASAPPLVQVPEPAAAPAVTGPGTLKIHVHPWGDIFVDGKPCADGNTTDCTVSVPPGEHTVKVVNPFQVPPEQRQVVTVAAGQTLPLKVDLGAGPAAR